jgi:hypothetical protein
MPNALDTPEFGRRRWTTGEITLIQNWRAPLD